MTYRMHSRQCPQCLAWLDAATAVEDGTPKPDPGDLTVCFRCGCLLRFGDEMNLRILRSGDLAMLHPEERSMLLALRARILGGAR